MKSGSNKPDRCEPALRLPVRCGAWLDDPASYLKAAGWKPHGNMWLDPLMRRIDDTDGAVKRQRERDDCRHAETVTLEGKRICNLCGIEVSSNDPS